MNYLITSFLLCHMLGSAVPRPCLAWQFRSCWFPVQFERMCQYSDMLPYTVSYFKTFTLHCVTFYNHITVEWLTKGNMRATLNNVRFRPIKINPFLVLVHCLVAINRSARVRLLDAAFARSADTLAGNVPAQCARPWPARDKLSGWASCFEMKRAVKTPLITDSRLSLSL